MYSIELKGVIADVWSKLNIDESKSIGEVSMTGNTQLKQCSS